MFEGNSLLSRIRTCAFSPAPREPPFFRTRDKFAKLEHVQKTKKKKLLTAKKASSYEVQLFIFGKKLWTRAINLE